MDSPRESVETLMEGLRQNWMKRNVVLQTFEQELTEAAETILGEKDGIMTVLNAFAVTMEVSSDSSSARLESTSVAESVEENVPENYLYRELKRFKRSTDEMQDSGESDEDNIEASLRDALDSTVAASQSKRRSRIQRQRARVKACESISGQYKAAMIITASVRRWYYNRHHSARVIQRFFRGWVARKRITSLREQRLRLACCLRKWHTETHRLKRARACTKIQSLWRGHALRLSIHRVKRNAFRSHMEELFRLYLERREKARRTEAASTIQRAWKTFIAQRYFGALCRSSLIFQSIWRGARVRRAVRQYRLALGNAMHVEIELADADENDFAEIDTDPLQDVFSNFKSVTRTTLDSTEQPSRERDAPKAFAATSDKDGQHAAATEYFIRRRKRHLRQQHRRQRSDKLKSDPSCRLARFLSNAAKKSKY